MKVTQSELKTNPQGTNSGGEDARIQLNNLEGIDNGVDEAKNQINDWKRKEEKDIQSVQQEKENPKY